MGGNSRSCRIEAREQEAKVPTDKQLAFILGLLISGYNNCAISYLIVHLLNNWLPYYCQFVCVCFFYFSSFSSLSLWHYIVCCITSSFISNLRLVSFVLLFQVTMLLYRSFLIIPLLFTMFPKLLIIRSYCYC